MGGAYSTTPRAYTVRYLSGSGSTIGGGGSSTGGGGGTPGGGSTSGTGGFTLALALRALALGGAGCTGSAGGGGGSGLSSVVSSLQILILYCASLHLLDVTHSLGACRRGGGLLALIR